MCVCEIEYVGLWKTSFWAYERNKSLGLWRSQWYGSEKVIGVWKTNMYVYHVPGTVSEFDANMMNALFINEPNAELLVI